MDHAILHGKPFGIPLFRTILRDTWCFHKQNYYMFLLFYRHANQRCQVRDFIPSFSFEADFYLKKSISGFFWDFSEREVRSLEMDIFVKLTRNKQFC
jgi:hypothetical protein